MGQERAPQTPARSSGYDLKREGTLVGTVMAYTESSTTPPLGAHVTLQTPGGVVDVHLGDARLLTANHFNIQAGDTLRIIGENVASGNASTFLARIVQKGTQALAVRSERGIPVRYMAPKNSGESKPQGGVL
jgi:ATPase subunit of ABC transporter with duplicated ATPase domains